MLVRLPYDKGGRYTFMSDIAPSFTDRGYAFVVQDVRGKFRSEGETLAFVHEVDDGYDTLEWMVAQPWCDGNIGMWGDSYYGYTQWAAVASEHPALKAIVPRVTTADLAGSVGNDPVIPLYLGEYLAMYWLDDKIYHWAPDYGHRPLAEVFDEAFEAIGRRAASFDRFVTTSAAGDATRALSRASSVRRAAHPRAAHRRLVRQHHAGADARLRRPDRAAGPRPPAVPRDELDGPRELPPRPGADPTRRRPRHG